MMKSLLILTAAALMAVTFLPPATSQASGGPTSAETTVFDDAEGDLVAPAPYLDILALHGTERYRYDFEKRAEIGTAVFMRIETAGLDDVQANVVTRYHVFGEANGSGAFELWADVTRDGDNRLQVAGTGANNDAAVNPTSVTLIAPYGGIGLAEGGSLSGLWAATSSAGGDAARFFHDVAPSDNGGVPAGSEPSAPSETGSYAVVGPYPFVDLIAKGPLERFSAEGSQVDFRFDVVTSEGVSGEIVRFYFQVPEGWEVEPSRGETTPEPVGEMTNVNHPATIEFVVSMTAKGVPEMNSTAAVVMDMISTSGSHERVEMTAIVTGPKLDSDEYEFQILSGTSYSPGDASRLEFSVSADNGSVPSDTRVKVDFFQQGQLVDTVDAKPSEDNGTYVAEYGFPSEGIWVADVYLANMRPSPHEEFEVNVESGGLMPGPGVPLIIGLLAAATLLAARRRYA